MKQSDISTAVICVLNLDEMPVTLDPEKVARHWISQQRKDIDWDTLTATDERQAYKGPGKNRGEFRARVFTVRTK